MLTFPEEEAILCPICGALCHSIEGLKKHRNRALCRVILLRKAYRTSPEGRKKKAAWARSAYARRKAES